MYIAEENNYRIQKLNSSGVSQWEIGSYGTADGQFAYPQDIAVDSSGYVYVADGMSSSNNRIQKFTSSGTFVTKFGSS